MSAPWERWKDTTLRSNAATRRRSRSGSDRSTLASVRTEVSSMPAIAASASFCRPELQGVMVLWPLATPTMGFLKSPAS